jgi:ATP-dependent Clp protease ATP-binding subunit ClpA
MYRRDPRKVEKHPKILLNKLLKKVYCCWVIPGVGKTAIIEGLALILS